MKTAILSIFAVLFLATPVMALTLDLETELLGPLDNEDVPANEYAGPIQITVIGGGMIGGLNLYLESGNGIAGPKISYIDFGMNTTYPGGSLWGKQVIPDPDGLPPFIDQTESGFGGALNIDPSAPPGLRVAAGLILQNDVEIAKQVERPAAGLVATVYLDTRGVPGGTYDLKMTYLGGDQGDVLKETTFLNAQSGGALGTNLDEGQVQVIPEPATLAMLAGLLAGAPLLMWYRRRTR